MGVSNKYRARRVDNDELIVGYLIQEDIIVGPIVELNEEYFNSEFWYRVKPETIEHFIGRLDSNGDEIYSGDKLRWLHGDGIYTIVWGDLAFGSKEGYDLIDEYDNVHEFYGGFDSNDFEIVKNDR